MFNSAIIDTAIGIVFLYLLLSLIASAVAEAVESVMRNRATDLERGIRELLTDQKTPGGLTSLVYKVSPWASKKAAAAVEKFVARSQTAAVNATVSVATETTSIVTRIYDHPLINGLYKGTYQEALAYRGQNIIRRFVAWLWRSSPKLPTYIPSRSFALALLDVAVPADADTQSGATGTLADPKRYAQATNPIKTLREAIVEKNVIPPDSKLGRALLTLIDSAGNDLNQARINIEAWFDSGMDRVSGWYKRRAQFIIFIIGLVVAIALNADTVFVVRKLSTDKELRDSVAAAAIEYAKANATASPTPAKSPPGGSPSSKSSATASPSPASTPTTSGTPVATSVPPAPRAAGLIAFVKKYSQIPIDALSTTAFAQTSAEISTPKSNANERTSTPTPDRSPSGSPATSPAAASGTPTNNNASATPGNRKESPTESPTTTVAPPSGVNNSQATKTEPTPSEGFFSREASVGYRDFSAKGPVGFVLILIAVFLGVSIPLGWRVTKSVSNESKWKLVVAALTGVAIFLLLFFAGMLLFGTKGPSTPVTGSTVTSSTPTPGPPQTSTPSPTPNPIPTVGRTRTSPSEPGGESVPPVASASPIPTPPPADACWADACKGKEDSVECKARKNKCSAEACWQDACKEAPDSPACKFQKSQCELNSLGLPVGWSGGGDVTLTWPGWHWKQYGGWWWQIYWHGIGWLLTALAISLGAPFWFDLLNKFIVIRSTVKPKEKSPEEKSKD